MVMSGKVLELQCDKVMDKFFAEGIAQGEASGERKMTITMAQSMLRDHKEMEEICRYTNLSEAEVKELEKELKSEAV